MSVITHACYVSFEFNHGQPITNDWDDGILQAIHIMFQHWRAPFMSGGAAVLIFAEILAIVLTCHQSSVDCELKIFVG